MRKAKKNIGSKNGLEKACKSGGFTKKEECEAEKRSYSHRIGAKCGLFGKMNSMSTTFMLKTSSSSTRFYDKFASEDQCAENLLMLDRVATPPLLNDEVLSEGADARWTWRGRAITCCPLHLKAKKGISSQVDAYK
ncbi:hypothetical protein PIB30_032421 [Stylosanthes scabra]|uniref:Uncharacterized protein n=1 Tax=Stylosanthes scabra TaxID=79078 RepID=A0ABU6YCT6_9FABA|nr:hypothetical protein [Stylosanthes scabra]